MVEAVQCVMHRFVDLRLHDRLRQRHLHLLEQRLDGRVADLFCLLYPLEPAHLVAEARLQLVNGVEFACQLGEFVVQFRQLAFLDRGHRDGHLRALASMLTGDQRGGEHPALPRGKSDDRVVEAVDELTRTHLVRHAFGRRVGNRFAVNGGRHVDRDDIALLRSPFHRSQRAEAGAQRLQLGLHLLVGDFNRINRDGQRVQIGQLDLRPDVHLGGEHQLLAVLDFGDLDLGLADRLHVRGRDGLAVAARQRIVDDLLKHRAAADAGLEQLGGGFTGPEPRQANLLRQLLVRAVEVGLQLGEGHLHVDPDPGGAQLLNGAFHVPAPHLSCSACPRSQSSCLVSSCLVGVTGFEPAAFRSQSGCATKLRYTPRARHTAGRGATAHCVTRRYYGLPRWRPQLDFAGWLRPLKRRTVPFVLSCGRSSVVEP